MRQKVSHPYIKFLLNCRKIISLPTIAVGGMGGIIITLELLYVLHMKLFGWVRASFTLDY